jgi:hypothetical protein
MVNRRIHSAAHRGLPEAQAPSAGHRAGGGCSLQCRVARVRGLPQGCRHRYSRGCSWRAGPAEIHAPRSRSRCAAARSSVRGINGSAAVLCRRPNPARATTGATRAALPRDAFARSRSPGAVSAWVTHACQVFSKCAALLDGGPTIRNDNGGPLRRCDGRIGQRRSVVRCGQGDANATTRNDRERAMPPASNAADPTRLGQRWRGACRGRAKIRGPMARDCGTGFIHCGGQTDRRFAAEMR